MINFCFFSPFWGSGWFSLFPLEISTFEWGWTPESQRYSGTGGTEFMYATQLPSLCDGGDDSQAELHNQVPMRIYPLGYEQMNTG